MTNKRFMLEVPLDVPAGDLASLFKYILEEETSLTVTVTELSDEPTPVAPQDAGLPALGTMAVCVKCGQEVVYKVDLSDDKDTLSWWALVDPDGDEDPFLCRPRGGGALTMHSADSGVEQS
jgi:hypothetical protein